MVVRGEVEYRLKRLRKLMEEVKMKMQERVEEKEKEWKGW